MLQYPVHATPHKAGEAANALFRRNARLSQACHIQTLSFRSRCVVVPLPDMEISQ
jgi:hypothetical protein